MSRTALGRVGLGVGFFIVLLFAVRPESAHACTGDPPDPAQAVLIVEGWVARATLRPDLPSGFPVEPAASTGRGGDPFVPVEIVLRVEHTLKGSAPNALTFFDTASVPREPLPDGSRRFGGNSCLALLTADPTGKYAVLLFFQGADGRLFAYKGLGSAFGAGPEAPGIERVRQYALERLLPSALPRTGAGATGPTAPHWPGRAVAIAALALAGAPLAGGAIFTHRRTR
jgi:hypothetical protein